MTYDAEHAWSTEVVRWASGPWSVALADGSLTDISYLGQRLLSAVRPVVRDADWDVRPLRVSFAKGGAEAGADGCVENGADGGAENGAEDGRLDAVVETADDDAALLGHLRIRVDCGTLMVTLELTALADVTTNRVGLVVLHPADLSGAPVEVTHPDETAELGAFPVDVAAHQPFVAIRRLRWGDGSRNLTLSLDGDVFEMEDQRNWTDASFKTYNRPLALPFPFVIPAGEKVDQRIVLTVDEPSGDAMTAVAPPLDRITVGSSANDLALIELLPGDPFPGISVGAATGSDPAPRADLAWAASVLVELDLATANWRAALARASEAGRPLDVRLVLSDDDPGALDEAVSALAGVRLIRVAVFHPTGPARHVSDTSAIRALRAALDRERLRVPIVGGARSHFTELNREHHRLPDDLDGVVFALTPGFHDRTTVQLIQSVGMQRIVATQAVRLADGTPVHVGPVTLRPRFNDAATSAPPRPPDDTLDHGYGPHLIDADDPRQAAPQLAAWTIASAAALAIPGVAGLTYFEEWGERGIRARDGAHYPVADALKRLAALTGTQRLHGESPDGLVWALGGSADGRESLLVANLDVRPRMVQLISPAGRSSIEVAAGGWAERG